MMVSRYFASYGFDIDRNSVRRVDSVLNRLEQRFARLGQLANRPIVLDIARFNVDQRRLNIALGNALDIASTTLVFDIHRFHVNQAALNRDVANAFARASATNNLDANARVRAGRVGAHAGSAIGGGMIGRGLSSFYGPAIALGLGGYGLSALNRRNQEVVAAQLQTQAVLSGNADKLGLTPEQATEQGKESFDWLRKQANRVGFNYLEASSDFNVLTSNLLGSGGTLEQSRNIFKGFAEYGRVNKLSPARQKLVFNALSQIAGKDKLQAEELTKQLGNSLPGAKDIFAQAYQQMTGGKLTGSEAIIALEAAMKKGQVRGSILDVAATIASTRSQPGLEKASQASQAEQARFQNATSDLAILASNAGVEEGFARIFRTLTMGLQESNGLVQTLAEGFNEATKWADDLMLFPQSFVRALEGRDSLVADWLGIGKTSQLVKDWQDIRTIWGQLNALDPSKLFGDFLPSLESTAKELAAILDTLAGLGRIFNGQFPTQLSNRSETEKASIFGFEYTSPAAIAGDFFNNAMYNIGQARERDRAINDPNSPYYGDPEGYNEQKKGLEMSVATDTSATFVPSTTTNQFEISINIDPVTLANMDIQSQAESLGNWFRSELENAQVNFPQKE